jgi:hypothetical protein
MHKSEFLLIVYFRVAPWVSLMCCFSHHPQPHSNIASKCSETSFSADFGVEASSICLNSEHTIHICSLGMIAINIRDHPHRRSARAVHTHGTARLHHSSILMTALSGMTVPAVGVIRLLQFYCTSAGPQPGSSQELREYQHWRLGLCYLACHFQY